MRCRQLRYLWPLAVVITGLLLSAGGGTAQQVPPTVEGKKELTASIVRFGILVALDDKINGNVDGAVGGVVLVMVPKETDDTSLGYLESTPNSTGRLWQYSGWSAITTAGFFLDRPLRYRIGVEFEEAFRIDGPSASAMLTVALLAVVNGHRLREGASMTGMIMPDG